ncbi:MAG: type I-E CRISPR-associated protein Cas5/CasD [Sphaerochaetaceae bacterium]|jgi:CRISPR system Cascade subunit CasD|nr:type I-E CRISPR-associated protein Cas5/CasD [Sphaerochaetaceae bacterium]
MNTRYLLLWLEAPLQSWGCHSKFGPRDTCEFPTKSGIYGLFLSALGYKGNQESFLEKLNEFNQTVLCFNKEVFPPRLKDFQMVGSGYNRDDKWEALNIPRKADGGIAVASRGYGGTKMTYRYYIQDGVFAVIQELDDDLAELIANALKMPIFDSYFGRKNCIPTDLIFRGVFDSLSEAKVQSFAIAQEKGLKLQFTVSEKEESTETMILNDVPISFGEEKEYKDRQVFIKRTNGEFSFIDQDHQE